jgi:hypothetical protein
MDLIEERAEGGDDASPFARRTDPTFLDGFRASD